MVRCAYAHGVADPKWEVRGDYRQVLELELTNAPLRLDLRELHGRSFDFAQLGGHARWFEIRDESLATLTDGTFTPLSGGICPGPLQAEHPGRISPFGEAVCRPRDRGVAGSRGAAQGHRRPASRPAGQALPGQPDARGAIQDVFARRSLGLAPRRHQSLPACQALQGAQAGAVPVAGRDRAGWARSCARPKKRCPRQ